MRIVELSQIRIDGGTQPRAEIDQKTVDEYAEAYAALVQLPPVVVYFDGANAWLADGFHRYHAAKKVGVQAVDVDWREGTIEVAKFYASGANVSHGLRRKDSDKKRAILMLLETDQGKRWSAEKGSKGSGLTAIAKHCGVSVKWAGEVLASLSTSKSPTRAEKRSAVEAAIEEFPRAGARELARALEARGVKVHHETVQAVREEKALTKAAARMRADSSEAPAEPGGLPDSERSLSAEGREAKATVMPAKLEPVNHDPLKGCASMSERDAVDAWVAQGAMLYERFGEGAREYMRTSWGKRLARLEGQ
jgi:hypothetical protein